MAIKFVLNETSYFGEKARDVLPEEIKKKLVAKKHVILLGDQESDLRMVDSKDHKSVINIGFFSTRTETPYDEYIKYFDIVCNEEDNYKVLMKKLFR